jgi:hypothetical protein
MGKPFINEEKNVKPNIIVSDEWSFDFDHLDTIPYWYGNLGNYFGLSGLQIAVLAQDIICKEWGFTGNIREENYVHTADGDWHLVSNRHGSVPQVETLRTYYEFHAMFCIAGNLIKTHTQQNKDYRTFEGWLAHYATVWKNKWLSDLRDPEPLLPIISTMNNGAEDWLSTINWDEYEEYIGLHNSDYSVVNSSFNKHQWKDYESINIESAFVNKSKAQALVRTLNDVENYRWYAIPSDEDSDDSFDENGFIFRGLLNTIKSSEGEMDEKDLFANDIRKFAKIPGKIIVDHKGLILSDDFRFSFLKNNLKPITVFENWNQYTEHDSSENKSEGYHLMIDKNYLLEILQKYDFCLLIEYAINRSKEAPSSSKEKGGYSDFVTLYLLYPDGAVESTRRYISVREKDY